MLKKVSIIVLLIFLSCQQEIPSNFSEKARKEIVYSLEDVSSTFQEVLNNYRGKKVLIDVWASWCRDCIEGIPKVKELQKEFPEVVYLFFVSTFLKHKFVSNEKKYTILNTILTEHNIMVLYGDDANYFENLDTWFNNSL